MRLKEETKDVLELFAIYVATWGALMFLIAVALWLGGC